MAINHHGLTVHVFGDLLPEHERLRREGELCGMTVRQLRTSRIRAPH